jgi:hypothetical protein
LSLEDGAAVRDDDEYGAAARPTEEKLEWGCVDKLLYVEMLFLVLAQPCGVVDDLWCYRWLQDNKES